MTVQITTETGREMLRSVTPIYNNDDLALAVFEANGKVMDKVAVVIEGLKTEMYPQNATWTLGYWEQMLGIKTNKNLPDSQRVQKVLFELNKYFTITRKRMEMIVNAFIEHQNAEVEDVEGEYAFIVIIPAGNRIGDGLRDAVEETKPAHLLAIYEQVVSARAVVIRDDTYHFPIYYPETGEFTPEKDFSQIDSPPIDIQEDSYGFEIVYPAAERGVSQADAGIAGLSDDTYNYKTDYPTVGEAELLDKTVTLFEDRAAVAPAAYEFAVVYPECGEYELEGED
ncbi:hypothetical protein HMPREF9372_3345 [Sporosarcina newyorkensis 2681]|uniref:DUF2313 domain-containing protein n=1 Tax=Sporosarcina newyorkensis 2681 TaxID=1027292 RepID=F9DX14_9BACL|nr:putative phage tail protein [Sporosarcina newyorkensis]EGQ21062.1 hypothetical protein HMPREF9372_3345 [Sporosarcina newyorkensis 2681]